VTARHSRRSRTRAHARAWLGRVRARQAAGLVAAGAALLVLGFAAGWIAGAITTGPEDREPAGRAPVASARTPAPEYQAPPQAGARPPAPEAPLALLPAPVPPPRESAPRGRIALVMDDLGLLEAATREAIALDPAVTLAFLPYAPDTEALARAGAAAGHEVLLHMPMEPRGQDDPGPDALTTALAPGEIRARLDAAFARVPGAVGLNNHMGSLFTADAEAMAVVLDEIRRRDMMILDSVTTPDSVVIELASALGVPSGARDVFLDNLREPVAIARQLDEVERLAAAAGTAVAIGHPYEETLAALARWMPGMRRRGFTFVPISAVATPHLPDEVLAEHGPPRDSR
jgi:polysaccharide deacetylase 2 family uncharacterized protein YibQ